MADLENPKWMYAKAAMLLAIGAMAFFLLLLPQVIWAKVILQSVMIWAFARAYYFAFYVVEHYIDGDYRFSGLIDFFRYVLRERRKGNPR